MSYDLNIPWPCNNYNTTPTPKQWTDLKNTLITNLELGITHQAINFTIDESVKIPFNTPEKINPIPITTLLDELKPNFSTLNLFTRVTLIVNDSSKLQGIAKLQNHFDLFAIQPTTEKALQLTILNIECDLISLNLSNKLPFFLKFKAIGTGVSKGIKFEINYSQLVTGSSGFSSDVSVNLIKKNWFNNVLQLIRSSRSRGIVVSSGAQTPLQLRNSNDILILLKTLGLNSSKAKSCITINPEKALLNARLRIKSYKQVISIGDQDLIGNEHEDGDKKHNATGYKRKFDDTPSGKLLKKYKTDTT
ncbi:Rpp1 protein [Candida orthopsilosis Co 90-125]|uniref:Rpp1 protein n=1 Tax=Candida orthopsilosis (strain 90-125) TaxID=1136231 RepID=H8X039_CANO9|nr:Rpp1 protein [Candida orthopsilosis Co 90-125]CCG22551.1 Rpp1 protein [Candida orthopsilosis Co 90-125]